VEGERLWNAFRWTASIGPWEERPGHFGDVWNYWTDDGLGYFEFLQVVNGNWGAHFLTKLDIYLCSDLCCIAFLIKGVLDFISKQ
jgi:hypothetical protein